MVFSPVSLTFAMELAANIIDPADAPSLQNRSASDRSMISPIDRILLPNALYFSGDLRFKFKRADTRKAVFRSENSTLGEVMASFTAETLDSIAAMPSVLVNLGLPEFESSASVTCNSIFAAMGIDLSATNISVFNKIYASKNYPLTADHEAKVKATKDGTEASASSAASLISCSYFEGNKPVKVIFDHPFAYFIRDTVTGSIIMIGQFTRPI